MDKEEIGAWEYRCQSAFLEHFIADICNLSTDNYTEFTLRRCISNSKCFQLM